jgi:hypothetical protein
MTKSNLIGEYNPLIMKLINDLLQAQGCAA